MFLDSVAEALAVIGVGSNELFVQPMRIEVRPLGTSPGQWCNQILLACAQRVLRVVLEPFESIGILSIVDAERIVWYITIA